MSESICRWGFLGTAAISRKVWKAVRVSGNGRVAAVASRSEPRAQAYIDQCSAEVPQIEPVTAVGSYQALLENDDIDAVYIPLPTGLRKEWVIAAAKAGKHVLCEKPAAVHSDDAKAMIDACNDAGVQFMDGVMFDHSARMNEIQRLLRDESPIGQLRRIHSHFSFAGDESFQKSNIRTDAKLEPHGSLGDLGWYCIRFTLRALNLQMPTHVSGQTLTGLRGSESESEVPGEFVGEMRFADGLSASFYCSFLSANQQTATISGQDGYLTVDDFVLPLYSGESQWATHHHELAVDNCRWNFSRHTRGASVPEFASGESNSQEVNMVRTMAQIALSGKTDPMYPELTIKTQQILDACRRSDAKGGQLVAV
ncbi:1,5-anhydro-D-fructose reductase [Rubripirellula lacrimiformis]|uniref:1,5-anhydro-D-fructose reductase n=1 Tax=Rubripirellula lacrimiformis TaxID=1930273 RepID=A0A517NG17_9BACT|nr:Gfo/Idh/MocA family oxidoreductase [Rubripirellula lacrimiformis]QDT06080.1 1,5-anhydro-D-fructose reductase [Rubripirellula lacrimiformis]